VLRSSPLVAALFLLCIAVACSSSTAMSPDAAIDVDAGPIDGSLGPFFCNLPVPATCPTTAPCTFSTWGCAQVACDSYFVVTDGAWDYYYSSPGGELAGEVKTAEDAGIVSCPYGFLPPTGCKPVVASQCSPDGGPAEAGAADGGSSETGAVDATSSDGGPADASSSDASSSADAD
jgi:hypothetical protein